jgi:hypothetical protein
MSVAFAFDQIVDTNLADRPVLVSAPLKPSFDRSDLSRFGDQSWDLGPAVFRENARRCHVTVHFGAIGDAATERALRELLYARLNVALPGGRQRLPPASIRQVFNRAKRFFDYVRTTLGAMDLARVDQNLIDAYARSLRADRRRLPNVNAQLLEVIVDLYAFRDHLLRGYPPRATAGLPSSSPIASNSSINLQRNTSCCSRSMRSCCPKRLVAR